jgi:molybdopterin molybdotransferase
MAGKDVRMRGFQARSTVDEALAWVDAHTTPLPSESVSLAEAWGRILAADVTARVNVPSFVRSAMDGYAVRGEETTGAGAYNPIELRVIGESFPGRPASVSVETGTCVRIMTGAPLPAGADAVLPVEETEVARDGFIAAIGSVSPEKHVGKIGEDVAAGQTLLNAGRSLRPQDVGLCAAVGVNEVAVVRRPRVALLVTGNELAAAGTPLGPYQIYDSNTDMLRGLVARDGGALVDVIRLTDDREAIRRALLETEADVLLFSGGSSVGAEDHAPSLVASEGVLAIHGIAMRPSSPAGMGTVRDRIVFLLPGNPVSCLCAYDFFAGRAIRRLGGRSADWPYPIETRVVARKLGSVVGRVDYARVRFDDGGEVEPLATSGASILSSTVRADGFVLIPAESEGYGPGTTIDVRRYV